MYRLVVLPYVLVVLILASCSSTNTPVRRQPLSTISEYGLDQSVNVRAAQNQALWAKENGVDLHYIGNYIPRIKVAPIYPPRARSKGQSGWALVFFTITETGSLEDIRVVDEYPGNVFAEASLQAVELFTYEPYIENGIPTRIPNVWSIFVYTLE